MNTDYRYHLDATRGTSHKYTCPNPKCLGKKSFRRYVDEQGNELGDECGICDHINSCGYHLPPREFFKLHPELQKDWRLNHPLPDNWSAIGRRSTRNDSSQVVQQQNIEEKAFTLDRSLVDRSRSNESLFVSWVVHNVAPHYKFSTELVFRVLDDYQLGEDRQHRVVFWLIDQQGRVRSGKMMEYGIDGHRMKSFDWVHSALMRCNQLDGNAWELRQCLFGEHLLDTYPSKEIGLVESEKSAIICSLFYPDMLWLATGSCQNLNVERVSPLIGRKVKVYPDSGEFHKWFNEMVKTSGIHFDITSRFERYPSNTDIADILLADLYAVH